MYQIYCLIDMSDVSDINYRRVWRYQRGSWNL